jgi:hypothetical protein
MPDVSTSKNLPDAAYAPKSSPDAAPEVPAGSNHPDRTAPSASKTERASHVTPAREVRRKGFPQP